jgi:L-lactate dehydrogenase (cytochrome)
MTNFSKCHNVEDLRQLARRRLPSPVADYLDGGADDEVSVRANRAAFESVGLVPDCLVGVEDVDLSTTVLGQPVSMPLLLAPAALHRIFHPGGELAVARAAAAFATMQFLSGMASTSLEDVARAGAAPRCFQVYPSRDRALMRGLLARVRAAGYPAICISVDVPVGGNRERDRRAGVAMPPKFSLAGWLSVSAHPHWVWGFLTQGPIGMPNVFPDRHRKVRNADVRFDAGVTWTDIEWLVQEWNGPVAIKGLLSLSDARQAAATGATAVVLSNHGGRQLDSAIAPLVVLEEVAQAMGDRMEILIDGGVRRGTDVVKALALGARACLIGRPYLYGLAAGGQPGVEHALEIFRSEIRRALALVGSPTLGHLGRRHVRVNAIR